MSYLPSNALGLAVPSTTTTNSNNNKWQGTIDMWNDYFNNPNSSGEKSWFESEGFGNAMKGLGALGQLGQAGVGLYQALLGQQALELAQDQFKYQKGLANTNLYNSATALNNELAMRHAVSTRLNGATQAEVDANTKAGESQYMRTHI